MTRLLRLGALPREGAPREVGDASRNQRDAFRQVYVQRQDSEIRAYNNVDWSEAVAIEIRLFELRFEDEVESDDGMTVRCVVTYAEVRIEARIVGPT